MKKGSNKENNTPGDGRDFFIIFCKEKAMEVQ